MNPYQAPQAQLTSEIHIEDMEYVGFWARTGASIIDTIIIMAVTYPILIALYGFNYFDGETLIAGAADVLLNYVFPALAVILFWIYRSATPGKMLLNAVIVDAKTGAKPSKGQMIGRYFAYYISALLLGLGFLWVAWDPRKQGFHDKLAGTVVVRSDDI
ncbi:predicted membrane protein/domain [Hahella chejuensis KCTC 2396]|uniref:Predicted membrane protein/domain n=1 Tax=Hahella chejuensis (strain KCTC 2396) TaxID=349521 RepID=Q2SAE0_HAHCH|nr:RDD family protein [Hahella chejuensis]ABC32384.1 predicted membrane protein/domain [Hahella chejuensis KCTC 2396]